VLELYRPPEWETLKKLDAERYRRGLPHILDTPGFDATPFFGKLASR
jgi:hypothetical protein